MGKLSYRPEIDGLRALAVLSVVLFHAKLKCPGGYVGVDVFFVISGFLITSVILRDLHHGKFSLAHFWERRIRRILPALSVMIVACLVVGGLLLLPSDFERLGQSAIAQALLAANIFFWRDDVGSGGYFSPLSEERPLLHTWSLSVEEQFYVLFPLGLMWAFRFKPLREPRVISWLLFVGIVLGLILSTYGVSANRDATFYLLPTRAWELMCGAWLASLSVSRMPKREVTRELASWLGLAGIVLPFWLYSDATPFPGIAAVPPCIGTCLVIWSNGGGESRKLTSLGRLLSVKPLVFVGLISYSLYLWHWPVLVFGEYWSLENWAPWYERIGWVLLSGLLAYLSWCYIETPFRQRKVMETRQQAFRFAAGITLLSLTVGAAVVTSGGFPERLPEAVVENDEAREDNRSTTVRNVTLRDVQRGRVLNLARAKSPNAPKILLWGDSHAKHTIPALTAFCKEVGASGHAVVHSATPPLLNAAFSLAEGGLGADTPRFSRAVLDEVVRGKYSHVILAARWSIYEASDRKLLSASLRQTISALDEIGCEVFILQSVPDVDVEPPKAISRTTLFGGDNDEWRTTIWEHREDNSILYCLANKDLPAKFLDPALPLIKVDSGRYRANIDGISIYHDSNHLTDRGSLELLLPLFREELGDRIATGG